MVAPNIRPGFYVQLVAASPEDPWNNQVIQIVREEASDYETGDGATAEFSTVASAGNTGFRQVTSLEPDKKRLAWYKWGVFTGGIYEIQINAGSSRLGVDEAKAAANITMEKSPWFDPEDDFGFYLVENWWPAINCTNTTPNTITPKVRFTGWRWDFKDIVGAQAAQILQSGKYTVATLGGVKQ